MFFDHGVRYRFVLLAAFLSFLCEVLGLKERKSVLRRTDSLFAKNRVMYVYFFRLGSKTCCIRLISSLTWRRLNDFPAMMSSTPANMNMMPKASRCVNASPNTHTPMATAVSGSNAPRMAVGVEPMLRTDIDMVTREITVGRIASIMAKNHINGVVSGCR